MERLYYDYGTDDILIAVLKYLYYHISQHLKRIEI